MLTYDPREQMDVVSGQCVINTASGFHNPVKQPMTGCLERLGDRTKSYIRLQALLQAPIGVHNSTGCFKMQVVKIGLDHI